MATVYLGTTGSGKTTKLRDTYMALVQQGVKTDEILVLVKGATNVSEWRTAINLAVTGPLHIYTYFGWIQRELTRFWTTVDAGLPGGSQCIEPTYMTTEASHYLMGLLVDKAQGEGRFPEVKATSQQIALQLLDNLNHGALNGLALEDIRARLLAQYPGDLNKRLCYEHSIQVMGDFRRQCLASRCLDYSLTLELYQQNLLTAEEYLAGLMKRFRYLLVDNLEEMVPAAQDFIGSLLAEMEGAFLAFNPRGGYGTSFGADPKLAAQVLVPRCKQVDLGASHTASPAAEKFAQALAQRIQGAAKPLQGAILAGQINENLRGDMFHRVGREVVKLLNQGIEPGDIVIIAPIIDKVMEFTLDQYLKSKGFTLANLTRNRRLLDQPFAQALITLALLANPQWQLQLNFSSLVQTLGMIIKTDPVRSALLAEEVFRRQLNLPDLDEVGLRPRIGFDKGDKYDFLKQWIGEQKQQGLELDLFFQQAFGQLLAPLMPGENDLLACRQLIDSVTKFRKVMERYPGGLFKPLGESFIDMVLRGTLAAETLFRPPQNREKIILATPYTFLFSPYIKAVKYQVWLDISGEQWMWGNAKELSNPYLLSRQWQEGQVWDDDLDQQLRCDQLARTVQSILGKCTGGLYLASSYLSSQGWEQDGRLAQWLEDCEVMDHA